MNRAIKLQSSPSNRITKAARRRRDGIILPTEDNTPESLQRLLAANARLRAEPWPPPYDHTTHTFRLGDARDLSWIADESIHLVVTSPPYWTLKQYKQGCDGQMGDIEDYEEFLTHLDTVCGECA